jgi:branched-chain amino acid aminotransferase
MLPRRSILAAPSARAWTSQRCLFAQRRSYAIAAPDAADPKLQAIDLSKLQVQKTTTPKEIMTNKDLVFGRYFTDHMLSLEWTASDGWMDPRIVPYQNLSLDPATCVFHYAFEAFEGMKAYKDKQGNVRLFRPDMNMKRLNRSVARIALPTFDGEKVIELIKKFCQMEERFIPSERGYSLYIRPNMIGTQRTLASDLLALRCST